MNHLSTHLILWLLALCCADCKEDTINPTVFGTLYGQVLLDSDNSAIANATISTTPPTSTVLTDNLGRFSFENIKVGTYTIRAEKSGFVTAVESITIFEGKTSNVVIKLSKSVAANNPPTAPILLLPADGASSQSISLTLRWSASDPDKDALSYDIKLFNPNQSPHTIIASNLTDTFLVVNDLKYETTYFWQVIVKDGKADPVQGPVWSFSTSPFPYHPFVFVKTLNSLTYIYAAQSASSNKPLYQLTDHPGSFRPRISPLGNRIACIAAGGFNLELNVMNRDGSGKQTVPASPSIGGFRQKDLDFAWSPDGTRLLFMNFNKLYRINLDGTGQTLLTELPQTESFVEVDWTSEGNLIATRTEGLNSFNSKILLYDHLGNFVKTLVPDWPGHTGGPAFSVDGKTIVFTHDVSGFESVADPDRQLNSDIFLMKIASGDTLNLSKGKPLLTNDLDPRFSPDGSAVIFINTNNFLFNPSIHWVNIMGLGRNVLFENAEMPDWR